MFSEDGMKTFVVGILHEHGQHGGIEISTTLGKLRAKDAEEAKRNSEFWVAKIKAEHECIRCGDNCVVDIREGSTGLKSTALVCDAETIG